jgi:hypothetical protein
LSGFLQREDRLQQGFVVGKVSDELVEVWFGFRCT